MQSPTQSIPSSSLPISHTDEINRRILSVSEDKLEGFHSYPFQAIAERANLPLDTVLERLRSMLAAGTIRRIRQTLMSTSLASGALVAWQIPQDKIDSAFEWMAKIDPFSGHVVIRSTDQEIQGALYKLWTTVKVPQGFSLDEHLERVARKVGALSYRAMPAKGIFTLGVGHTRRKTMEIGARSETPAIMQPVEQTTLSELEWKVLRALKRELALEEIVPNLWELRARETGVEFDAFCQAAEKLVRQKLIGRFSTFLEHAKPNAEGERVTRFNGLFHWAVPSGMEEKAGSEVGRHLILTHCYWRQAGPEFGNVNIMAVAHGTEKETVLAHKKAIDEHLAHVGIPVLYTNIFWGGRSEIKPSEIDPQVYAEWSKAQGL